MKTFVTSTGCIIQRIFFGGFNVFLIKQNDRTILVDTGVRSAWKKLQKRLDKAGRPEMVILTHTHFDHTGNAGNIFKHYSPVFIVQERERRFLEEGYSPIPHGTRPWTKFVYKLGEHKFPYWFRVEGVPDTLAFGERYDLSGSGISGSCLHTPGHSSGSVSVVLDNEFALVGDTLTGFIPGSAFPPWADDPVELIRSWKKLLDTGCHTFLPGHGFTLKRNRLLREFERRNRKINRING